MSRHTHRSRTSSAKIAASVVLLSLSGNAHGWSSTVATMRATTTTTTMQMTTPPPTDASSSSALTSTPSSRRDLFRRTGAALLSTAGVGMASLSHPSPAIAAGSSSSGPAGVDLSRVQKGQQRVAYLLNHWDELTQTCGTKVMSDADRKQVMRTEGGGGGICDKDPLRVQEYMGYKSINDPLYKLDKMLVKAAPMVDDMEDFLDVVERYRDRADQTAMLAYTSSWGEANPNGSKDTIDEYLEQTRVQVVESEKLLREIMGYLKLDVLPPLTKI